MNTHTLPTAPLLFPHAPGHRAGAATAPGARPVRGRPKGARTRVIREEPVLGRPHFAFLRACFQGLDAKVAWERYLGTADQGDDRRYIERRRRQLLAAVLRAGRQRARGTPLGEQVRAAVRTLYRQAPPVGAIPLPSLESWMQQEGLDPDIYGESELLAMYREHHGIDGLQESGSPDGGHGHRLAPTAQVRALNVLEPLLSRTAQPEDPVTLWVMPRLADGLRSLGLSTLGEAWQTLGGSVSPWYRPLRGIGRGQAQVFLAWLGSQADAWQASSNGHPPPLAGAAPPAPPCPFELDPGDPGCRNVIERLRGACDADRAALLAWMAGLKGTGPTVANYRREIERFHLWCVAERHITLRELCDDDVEAYSRFLADVPAGWTCRRPLPRADAGWRPFRGPLSPGSQRHAWVVIRRLLADLRAQGHLTWAPSGPVGNGTQHTAASASQAASEVWARQLMCAVERQKPSPRTRRVQAVIGWYLCEGQGFRAMARARTVLNGARPADASPPGGLPVKAHVRAAWRAHLSDAAHEPPAGQLDQAVWPLFLRQAAWSCTPGASRNVSPMPGALENDSGPVGMTPLTAGAVRAILARFMRKIASQGQGNDAVGLPCCSLRALRGALA